MALTRTPSTMLNRSDERRHPCLTPDLKGKALSLSPLSVMLTVGLLWMPFIRFRKFPSKFVEGFYHGGSIF